MASTEGLEESMARLSVVGQKLDSIDASERPVVDDILFKVPRQGKRKRSQSRDDNARLRHHLEDEFLRPSTTFSPEWLNRFQQYGSFPFLLFIVFILRTSKAQTLCKTMLTRSIAP